MKIGIDARLWGETGVGRYIRNLVGELQVLDQKNEYVLFVRKRDYDKVKFQISNFKFQIKIADIRWHTIDEQLKLPQILNKENLDLVHFPYFSIPVRYNRPFVMTIHDLIINHFPTGKASKLPLYLYQLKRMGYNYVVKHALSRAQKIIVPLNAVKKDLIDTLDVSPEKIAVTYEGFDERISNFGLLPVGRQGQISNFKSVGGNYFLYVGNAYPHKNLERLIKAFAHFRRGQNDPVYLLLVGKDDYFYKKLQSKIEKENYHNVIIRNNVTDREIAELYQNAFALVAPSLMEGFGLPVLEAMTMKCLVMASDIPSFREVAEDAAIFFDPYSITDIEEKMKFVIQMDKKEKNSYIKNGIERAGYFSWKRMAQETLDVYKSISG